MGTQEFGCFPLGMKISQNTSEEGPNPKEKKCLIQFPQKLIHIPEMTDEILERLQLKIDYN